MLVAAFGMVAVDTLLELELIDERLEELLELSEETLEELLELSEETLEDDELERLLGVSLEPPLEPPPQALIKRAHAKTATALCIFILGITNYQFRVKIADVTGYINLLYVSVCVQWTRGQIRLTAKRVAWGGGINRELGFTEMHRRSLACSLNDNSASYCRSSRKPPSPERTAGEKACGFDYRRAS